MFIVLLNIVGCTFQSPVLSSHHPRGGFLVTKPPIQVTYSGDLTKEDKAHLLKVIEEVSRIPYRPYNFNANHVIDLASHGSRSSTESIKSDYSTKVKTKRR